MPNFLGMAKEQFLQEFDSNSSRLIQLKLVSEEIGNQVSTSKIIVLGYFPRHLAKCVKQKVFSMTN